MLHGWKVGTIRNVQIYLHVSLIFLLFYIVLVASIQFPYIVVHSRINLANIHGTPLSWGVIFAFSLLGSVLVHEFAHVLVAQAAGAKVRSITLMMLGGVSQMDRMPEKDYAEFKIAIVGPLVSLAIAGLLFLIKGLSSSADVILYAYWLGVANLTLGIFNLLPVFPTDGGRVLRSILSARQGKLRGTRNAVAVSQIFAWVFGIVGFLQFNFLLMLIAVFLYGAAKKELLTLEAQNLLKGIRAGEVGRRIDAIADDLSLQRASELMVRSRCLVLPVRTGTGGLAVVNAEQIKRVPRDRWSKISVKEIMWELSQGVDVDEPLEDAFEHGLFSAAGGVPLLSQGDVVGIIRNLDLTEWVEIRSLEQEGA